MTHHIIIAAGSTNHVENHNCRTHCRSSLGQTAVHAQTLEAFQEYGNAVVGSYQGKVKLVRDRPGIGRAGDTVDATVDIRWILGKSAVEGRSKVGDKIGKWIVVWDPVRMAIRVLGVDSSGEVVESTIQKRDGKWVGNQAMLMADGRKLTFTSTLTINDDGRTHTYDGVDNVLDGQKPGLARRMDTRKGMMGDDGIGFAWETGNAAEANQIQYRIWLPTPRYRKHILTHHQALGTAVRRASYPKSNPATRPRRSSCYRWPHSCLLSHDANSDASTAHGVPCAETPRKVCTHRARSDVSGWGRVSPARQTVTAQPRSARSPGTLPTGILMEPLSLWRYAGLHERCYPDSLSVRIRRPIGRGAAAAARVPGTPQAGSSQAGPREAGADAAGDCAGARGLPAAG